MRKVLFETMDGLGDVLMLIPSLKVWYSRGYLVDVSSRFPMVFDNLPYVNKTFMYGSAVKNISQYSEYYNLSYKLSSYTEDWCRQHRVLSTAYLCNVSKEEISSIHSEIILSEQELDWATKVLPETEEKIVLAITSADPVREFYRVKRQELISGVKQTFPNKLIVLVGDRLRDGDWQIEHGVPGKREIYRDCLDIRGRTSVRELFAVIHRCDYCVTVDTSILHIAAAFKKHTVFLPSSIQSSWRAYPGMMVVEPPTYCYPCNQGYAQCRNKVDAGWCLGQVSIDKICQGLVKV